MDAGSYDHLSKSCHTPIEGDFLGGVEKKVSALRISAEDDDNVNFNSQSTNSSGSC